METYSVTSRILSLEEKTILFGNKLARSVTAVKALDLDNYLGIFKAMHDGLSINISCLEDRKGFDRIYIYCDLPVGSRYFNDINNRYNGNEFRSRIYDVPTELVKNECNSFLIPIIKDALSVFDINLVNQAPQAFYNAVNSNYHTTLETLLAGCFLNMHDNTCVSIATYGSIFDLCQHMDLRGLSNKTNADFLDADTQYTWYYSHFLVPPEIGKLIVDYTPSKEFASSLFQYFTNHNKTFVTDFMSLFNWSTTYGSRAQSIVIAPGYIKYNGYSKINDKQYMTLGWLGHSPLMENIGGTQSSSLTVAFEDYLNNSTNSIPGSSITGVSSLFAFNDSTCSVRYGSNRGSFVFLNKKAISTSSLRAYSNVPEFVELDKEFIKSIRQIFLDERENDKTKDFDTIRKREFSIKRETLLVPEEVENSRYITLRSCDSKLFVLTKTSKAKEAARKMAITRKITVAVQPVIDMAIRIFAASDLEVGMTEPELKFPLNCLAFYDSTVSTLSKDSKHLNYLESAILKVTPGYQKLNESTAADVVKSLYITQNYDGTPFLDWRPSTYTRSNGSYSLKPDSEQRDAVLGYAYGYFIYTLGDTPQYTGLYSPSSGMLNLPGLGYNIYSCARSAKFPPELQGMATSNSYYGRPSLTGIQLHYLYSNNFIGDNQELSDAIELRKKDNWISLPTNLVTATTAFTFSQDALDTFSTLKKCRSLKDYSNWFNKVKPILQARLTDVICVNDPFANKVSLLILAHFGDLLERLATHEAPFLPKEEVKATRKKKDAETEASDEDSDNKETKETSTAILAVIKGEVNGTDAGTTGK